MGKGILPTNKIRVKNDEIGEMSSALNDLVDGLKATSQFSITSPRFHQLQITIRKMALWTPIPQNDGVITDSENIFYYEQVRTRLAHYPVLLDGALSPP